MTGAFIAGMSANQALLAYRSLNWLMTYSALSLDYSSGTGNSLRVAKWLEEYAKSKGLPVSIRSIAKRKQDGVFEPSPSTLFGLVYPTHGFTASWHLIRFALVLPKGKGTHAFVIPTRAGTKFGPFFFPGLEGTAGYLIALILAMKGYSVRGVMGLDMPSNWTQLHPGFRKENAEAIIQRAKPKTMAFIDSILVGNRAFGGLFFLLLGVLLLPVSILYLIIGRFMLAKIFFASDKCNQCNLCVDLCPNRGVEWKGNSLYWNFSCEACMRCMNICPTQAIEASYPLAAWFIYLGNIPLIYWFFQHYAPVRNPYVIHLFHYGYVLLSLFISYWIYILLSRIPFLQKIFTLTTLTHYYRRYREPGTKPSDFC